MSRKRRRLATPQHEALELAHHLIRTVVSLEPDIAARHLWAWEGDRWKELVFALLTEALPQPQPQLHDLCDYLAALELLNISDLVALPARGSAIDFDRPTAKRAIEAFRAKGFSSGEAKRALTIIREAARGLHDHFASKVQAYLRHYASIMLGDVSHYFKFSTLDSDQQRRAFTFWLQNVSNAPLSLRGTTQKVLCARYGLTQDELLAAADDLDVNLAVVDDAVRTFVANPLFESVLPKTSSGTVQSRKPRARKT